MGDGKFWTSKGYKLLSGSNKEDEIYYRIIGEKLKTHISLRSLSGKKELVDIEKADTWLIQRLKDLGEKV